MKLRLLPALCSVLATSSPVAFADPGKFAHKATKAAAGGGGPAPAVEVPEAIRGEGYQLVFQDEFDGAKGTPPDPAKWSQGIHGKWRDLWNVEDACRLDGEGNLRIEVRKNGDRYETGYLGTQGKFEANQGYFECRCRMQRENGFWSAFWLMPRKMEVRLDDPGAGGVEIDVMEHLKWKGEKLSHTAHWGLYKEHHQASSFETRVPGLREGFHTFAVKWDETGYEFYVDGRKTGRLPDTVPLSKQLSHVLLTCESEKWAGDITKAKLPDAFTVDYVRVWQTPAQIEADRQRRGALATDSRRPPAPGVGPP